MCHCAPNWILPARVQILRRPRIISKKRWNYSLNAPQRKKLSNVITVKPISPQWRLRLGKLRVLSGKEVCLILLAHGFEQVRQKGSHIIMQKQIDSSTITVPVPQHKEIKAGTLVSIIRQAQLPRSIFEN